MLSAMNGHLGVSVREIHNHLVEVYGQDVVVKKIVQRWCCQFTEDSQQVLDRSRAGRTCTSTTDKNTRMVDDRIKWNRRPTIDDVAEERGIRHARTHSVIHDILQCQIVSPDGCPEN